MKHSDNQTAKNLNARPAKPLKFVGVLGAFCVLFLASVFVLDTLFSNMFPSTSPSEQIALASDKNSVADELANSQNQLMQAASINVSKIESHDVQEDVIKNSAAISDMSESDFRQEAQNIILREADHLNIQAANQNAIANANFSTEDFRVEAKRVLYRDER